MPRRPETPRWKGPPNAECLVCGAGFYKGGPSAVATRLFCSRKCRWVAQRRQDFRPCFVCGKPFLPTDIEGRPPQWVGDSLMAAGLEVVPQFPINNRYFADFALPQLGIIVEVDGDYWHSLPKAQRNDKIKTALLQEQGWDVRRLRECDLRADWEGTLRPIISLGKAAQV